VTFVGSEPAHQLADEACGISQGRGIRIHIGDGLQGVLAVIRDADGLGLTPAAILAEGGSGKARLQAGKVEAGEVCLKKLERLEGAVGSMCITDAAKTLGVGRDALISRMQAMRWIYKRTGNKNWVAYHDKLMAGFLEHDDHIYFDGEGRERVSTRALVTVKGLVKFAEMLNQPLH